MQTSSQTNHIIELMPPSNDKICDQGFSPASNATLETCKDTSGHSLSSDGDCAGALQIHVVDEKTESSVPMSRRSPVTEENPEDQSMDSSFSPLDPQVRPLDTEDNVHEVAPTTDIEYLESGMTKESRRRPIIDELDVASLEQNDSNHKKRAIRFSEIVNVTHIVPLMDMVDNLEELWFQTEDYDCILERSYALVGRAEEEGGRAIKYCTRGLETLLENHDVSQAIDAVLSKQQEQWILGKSSESAISRVYALASNESREKARMRGEGDEKAVKSYLKGTRKYCRQIVT
eukprot:scaffold9079_cov120-Cylindrotheca_fusiformis.AAC.8